jgi:hypothetical protein
MKYLIDAIVDLFEELRAKQEKLDAALAALKAEKAKPAYDYSNPCRGDLFDGPYGHVYIAVPTTVIGMGQFLLVALKGPVGTHWDLGEGFAGNESQFTYLGNCNDNPNLLKENLP